MNCTCDRCYATILSDVVAGEQCRCGGIYQPTHEVYSPLRQLERQIGELRASIMGAACVECGRQLGLDWTRGKDSGTRHVRCALEESNRLAAAGE